MIFCANISKAVNYIDHFGFLLTDHNFLLLKPLQNKKGQKILGYPRKKQSFSL